MWWLLCDASLLLVVQAKKQYEKAFKDLEKVQEAHSKIEYDVNIPRIDVEKVGCPSLQLIVSFLDDLSGWQTESIFHKPWYLVRPKFMGFFAASLIVWLEIGYCSCMSHSLLHNWPFIQTDGDHLSGKPGNVRDCDSCQGNVTDFTKSQGNVREKILSGKRCLKRYCRLYICVRTGN